MKQPLIVCIGASLVDETYRCFGQPLEATSNPAVFYRTPGGVSRNIAHHLALLGNQVELISHFGNDTDGNWLINQCTTAGIGCGHSLINQEPTGRFTAILEPGGDLFTGAVASVFESQITPAFLESKTHLIHSAGLVLSDTNLSHESLSWLLGFCRSNNKVLVIEPVSVPKAARLQSCDLSGVLLITPNRSEMMALTGENKSVETHELINHLLEKDIRFLWMRDGKNGSSIYSRELSHHLGAPDVCVTDTTGAGDAGLAGWIHAYMQKKSPETCVRYGHALSALALSSEGAIVHELTPLLLETTYKNYTSLQ